MGALDSVLGGRLGTVAKAKFAVAAKNAQGAWEVPSSAGGAAPGGASGGGVFEVLINPASLKLTVASQMKREEGVANRNTPDEAPTDGKMKASGFPEQQLDMTLIFNIVEEYNAISGGMQTKALVQSAYTVVSSLIGGGGLGSVGSTLEDLMANTDFTALSILNPKLCCFAPLRDAAAKQAPVMFAWGNIVYTGTITKFQANFNYFSSQGAPLGAEVAISMISELTNNAKLSEANQKSFDTSLGGAGRLLPF